jgi:hypothetical protein
LVRLYGGKMLKRKQMILTAAVMAVASPLMSKAAPLTVSFGYDPTVTYGTNNTLTAGVGTATISGGQVNIPSGDFFAININALVTNNPNTSNPDPGSGDAQPANLGLSGFGFAIADNNPAVVFPRVVSGGAAFLASGGFNPNFTITSPGASSVATGDNGTNLQPISAGVNPANDVMYNRAASLAHATIGAGVTQDIATGLIYRVVAGAMPGSFAILTPNIPAGYTAVVVVNNPGHAPNANSTGTSDVTYTAHILNGSDILNPLPALRVNVPINPEHPLVSLTAKGLQNPFFGFSPIPPLHVTGSNGSYVGAQDTGLTTEVADVEVTGFNPATDNEVYALKLSGAGGNIGNIINEINELYAGDSGVIAELPTADVLNAFPGYQIELVAKIGSQSADQDLGIDLHDLGENSTPGTVTLSAVAVVPEPASIGLLMGASGLLMGRRKRNV